MSKAADNEVAGDMGNAPISPQIDTTLQIRAGFARARRSLSFRRLPGMPFVRLGARLGTVLGAGRTTPFAPPIADALLPDQALTRPRSGAGTVLVDPGLPNGESSARFREHRTTISPPLRSNESTTAPDGAVPVTSFGWTVRRGYQRAPHLTNASASGFIASPVALGFGDPRVAGAAEFRGGADLASPQLLRIGPAPASRDASPTIVLRIPHTWRALGEMTTGGDSHLSHEVTAPVDAALGRASLEADPRRPPDHLPSILPFGRMLAPEQKLPQHDVGVPLSSLPTGPTRAASTFVSYVGARLNASSHIDARATRSFPHPERLPAPRLTAPPLTERIAVSAELASSSGSASNRVLPERDARAAATGALDAIASTIQNFVKHEVGEAVRGLAHRVASQQAPTPPPADPPSDEATRLLMRRIRVLSEEQSFRGGRLR